MDKPTWSIEDSQRIYNVNRWGAGYFSIKENGHLCVYPDGKQNGPVIDMMEVYKEMKESNISLPAVIRFHDILRNQVKFINQTFKKTMIDADYNGDYYGVFPIKVNQLREVVDEVVDIGSKFNYGLESGSKAELVVALAMNTNKNSLTILNGHKDEEYLRLAFLGKKIGRKIIVVIEKYTELEELVRLSKELGEPPMIGLRCRLGTKGKGRWADSGGENAKFGLTASEIVSAKNLLEKEDLLHQLKLIHFHIGSQITDIGTIKDAISEASRMYCKLKKMGAPIEFFDAGGGVGVDYDGTKSDGESSMNYALKDYIADVVYILKQTCDLEETEHPNIVTETGRAITAHHSCVVTNVFGRIKKFDSDFNTKPKTGENILVSNMRELYKDLHVDKIQDIYNDAIKIKEESINAFKLGILELDERAKIETLFWNICTQILRLSQEKEFVPDEIKALRTKLSEQYLCNFSVFQSTPDAWAIGQLLPIVPLDRLEERPEIETTLADLTCDSDGKINNFISDQGRRKTLPLHDINPDEDYPIGIFLTGAYQDIMGDMHNLFGRLNEVHVYSDDDDPSDFYIEEIIRGNRISDVLKTLQYSPDALATFIKKEIDQQIQRGKIRPKEGVKLTDFYENCLYGYTYLS